VNIESIVAALKKERESIDRAIAALDGTATIGKAAKRESKVSKGHRRSRRGHLSAAGRKRLSDLMKRRWAQRRRKSAKT
jgi:hypothetical protein